VVQIIGVVLFVAIASILGLLRHGILGYVVMFAVLAAILALIYFTLKNRQRHFEITASNPVLKPILSAVMAVLALGLPLLIAITSDLIVPTAVPIIIAIAAILAFIALIVLALLITNRKSVNAGMGAAGYALVILAAILPGIMVLLTTNDSSAFAMAYLAALVAAVLAYFGLNLVYKLD
jgi:hypothetical protein